jgi:outer membrane receptor protein involved in Fe transport
MKTFSFKGGISSVSAYASFEGPVVKDRGSIILSIRSTYSDWILKRMPDPVLRDSEAGFYDLSGSYTHKLGKKNLLKVFGYGSKDQFRMGRYQTYSYGNSGASVDLHHMVNARIGANLAFVYSKYSFRDSDTQVSSLGFEHAYTINHHELRSDFCWQSLEKHNLSFGFSAIYYHLDRGVVKPYGENSIRSPLDLGKENGVESALYISDAITLSDRLSVDAGLRISTYMSLGPSEIRIYEPGMPLQEENIVDTTYVAHGKVGRTYYGLEPRLVLRYMVGEKSSVKGSYNRVTQYLFMLTNTFAISPTDQWKLCDYHIGPQYLDQVSAGFYHDFPGTGLSTSVELYRKWGHHLVEFKDGASFRENPHVETGILPGELKAYGFEAMIRKSAGLFQGWLSYNYSRSLMQVNVAPTGEQLNNGMPYPSNFDRPHSFSLITQIKRGRRISISSNLVYMTGRPVTYPVSLYYQYDIPYLHYSERNKYRIPDYFRLDLSLNIEGNLKRSKLFHSYWMISVYNLTGRKNAYSVYFRNYEGYVKGYKLSIFGQPIVTVSWNVKLGNYASD